MNGPEPKRAPPRGRSVIGELERGFRAIHAAAEGAAWPSKKYANDPELFASEILGVELWEKQREILRAIAKRPRVAVSGGRKIGKDFVIAVAALWWFASFADARVIMIAPSAEHVDGVLYRQIRELFVASGRCLACKKLDPDGPRPCQHSRVLGGEVNKLACSGIRAGFREIVGRTAAEAENMAGTSGTRLLYLLDEASAISDGLHTAIRGNMAAGETCREVLISNPTRTRGFFFDAFRSLSESYTKFVVSSEETPNVVQGREVIPGLASRSWIEEQKRDWGADSALYRVHVLGLFAENESGRLLSSEAILAAEKRWPTTPAEGRLCLGIDPAGDSGLGDDSVFALRRGKKVLRLVQKKGLTAEAHLVEALGLLQLELVDGDEVPRITVDRDGQVGAAVHGVLLGYLQSHENAFRLVGMRGGEKSRHEGFGIVRDDLWMSLAAWIREGGAIPTDPKLAGELNAVEIGEDVRSRARVTPKDKLRKLLGRSPDRADAVALAVWEPRASGDWNAPTDTQAVGAQARGGALDPYAGLAAFDGEGGIDPYAGLDSWGKS